MDEYAALIALDWADKKHDGCILERGSKKRTHFQLRQKPAEIDAWATKLRERFKGKKVAVITEQSRGALVYALMKYDFLELYPVNPTTLAKFREAFAPSGAKDDPTDADFMLEILLKHNDKLRVWKPDTVETRELQLLVEQRRTLVNDRKRLGNRLTSLLKCYYPQVLELFPKMGRAVLCEFVLSYPTLEDGKKATDAEFSIF